jgi:hypothetical protein
LLAALFNDTKLHRPLLATASALTSHYPTATELSLFLAEGRGDFPAAWVRALRRACDLFRVIWHEQLGSAETQEAARHVLRHYPDEQTLLSLPASPWLGQWLEPPYPFRRPSNPEDASGSIPDAADCSQQRLDSYECEVQFVGELPDLG